MSDPPWLSSSQPGSRPDGADSEDRDVLLGPVTHIHEDLVHCPCLVGLKKDSLFGQAIEL